MLKPFSHYRIRQSLSAAILLGIFLGVSPVLAATKPARVYTPRVLLIPKIGVNAVIEARGSDSSGNMLTPVVSRNVSWFSEGVRPGEKGNAVISGHLDWYDGPSTFWRLRDLKVGDYVLIQDDHGQALRFKVIKKATYPRASAPMNEIAGSTSAKHLNLVTCAGTYSRAVHNYSHRLIIYTELVP